MPSDCTEAHEIDPSGSFKECLQSQPFGEYSKVEHNPQIRPALEAMDTQKVGHSLKL